jgi:hypothetical protein
VTGSGDAARPAIGEGRPMDFTLSLDLAFAPEDSDAVLAVAASVTDDALDTRSVMSALPYAPHIPRHLRGRTALVITGTYRGSLQDAYHVVRPLRTAATPLLDRTEPVEA